MTQEEAIELLWSLCNLGDHRHTKALEVILENTLPELPDGVDMVVSITREFGHRVTLWTDNGDGTKTPHISKLKQPRAAVMAAIEQIKEG